MRDDENALARAHARRDRIVPIRQEALDGVLQTFGQRGLRGREFAIARIMSRETRIVALQRGWRNIVAATPDEHLRVAELGRGLGFVEPLQRAVMTLVEPP